MRSNGFGRFMVAVVAAVGVTLTIAPGSALAGPATPPFGPGIDAYAAYDGQDTCDPTAKPGVTDFKNLVNGTYGSHVWGISRSCSSGGTSEHKEGRALDYHFNSFDAGQRADATDLLNWMLATDAHGNRHAMARRLGIMYIIWNRQIWRAYQPSAGWQSYTGANPHTDHIHFSFSWPGALKQTSWWTGHGGANGSGMRDVTGDGKSDLVGVHTDNSLYRYAGSGTGGLAGTQLGPGWSTTRLITLADFTGDGNADLLAIRTDGSLYHYTGTGNGGFQTGAQLGPGWSTTRLITSADFNGDGRADLLAIRTDGSLHRYNGNANGTISSAGVVGTSWSGMRLITAADVTGDGNADILAVHTNGDLYHYKGNGNGTIQGGVRIWEGGWSVFRMITAADYTSDGNADLLAIHTNGDLYRYNGNTNGTVSRIGPVGHGWTTMRLINT